MNFPWLVRLLHRQQLKALESNESEEHKPVPMFHCANSYLQLGVILLLNQGSSVSAHTWHLSIRHFFKINIFLHDIKAEQMFQKRRSNNYIFREFFKWWQEMQQKQNKGVSSSSRKTSVRKLWHKNFIQVQLIQHWIFIDRNFVVVCLSLQTPGALNSLYIALGQTNLLNKRTLVLDPPINK